MRRPDQIFPGVYAIRCKVNGKIYIGSSIDVHYRLFSKGGGHFASLKSRRHHNKFVQKDYDAYKEDSFEIAVLEVCTTLKEARASEQWWIDVMLELAPNDFYNISSKVDGYDGKHRRRTVSLKSPTGTIETITGIKAFCRKNNLDMAAILRVIKNPRNTYKGWKNVAFEEREGFSLVDPAGMAHDVPYADVDTFCSTHQLNRHSLCALRAGRRKSYNGWSCSNVSKRVWLEEYKWKDSTGAIVAVSRSELKAYCKAHGHFPNLLVALAYGTRHRYKDLWELSTTQEEIDAARKPIPEAKPPLGDWAKKTYTLRSPDGGLVTFRGLKQFCKDNNLPKSSVCLMLQYPFKHTCRGWSVPTDKVAA